MTSHERFCDIVKLFKVAWWEFSNACRVSKISPHSMLNVCQFCYNIKAYSHITHSHYSHTHLHLKTFHKVTGTVQLHVDECLHGGLTIAAIGDLKIFCEYVQHWLLVVEYMSCHLTCNCWCVSI